MKCRTDSVSEQKAYLLTSGFSEKLFFQEFSLYDLSRASAGLLLDVQKNGQPIVVTENLL